VSSTSCEACVDCGAATFSTAAPMVGALGGSVLARRGVRTELLFLSRLETMASFSLYS
jgi:hypothetical protein